MSTVAASQGIIHVPSRHSVAELIDRFEALAKQRGLIIFLRLDQQAEAEKVGLTMRPTQLLIFGNPKSGTPLMTAVPGLAIDLPIKLLAWQDDQMQVWLSYNDVAYLKERHGLTDEQAAILDGGALVRRAAGDEAL